MHPYSHILCPIDFSDHSRRALDLAQGLCADLQARLTVLHVADTRQFAPAWEALAPGALALNRKRVEEQLLDLARQRRLQPEQVALVDGLPAREIAERSRKDGIDLIVMGSHGVSGFERLLLGSVTEKVLHHVDIPLLVVSRPSVAAKPAPEQRFGTILLATDLSTQAIPTVEAALFMARTYRAKLVLVHALPTPAAFFGPMEAPYLSALDLEPQLRRLAEERRTHLEKLVPADMAPLARPQFVITEGPPELAILDAARDHGADLIVIGAHGLGRTVLGWIGSTSHRVLRHADCPVLTVRSPA